MSTVVVVEGESDKIAIEALAERRGIELADAGVRIVPLGGAHRIRAFLGELDLRSGLRVAGLCDAREEPVFRNAFERPGLGRELLGFYVCVEDLEDELIRALGVPAVEEVVAAAGDLQRLRKLQQMPAWRDRAADEQIRRFIAAGARRKLRYARLLVDALDLERVPRPLDGVLRRAVEPGDGSRLTARGGPA
ncbi:MAG TPA: TOPRIM nucleotidyl transferase/hydrolase domain-containing protein [Thermoleophilaceae bacterium]|nr:TOPRIM nucleotidyl transferase/hydrolase domain-containing protein [Thermoleophilaceae bacterium]